MKKELIKIVIFILCFGCKAQNYLERHKNIEGIKSVIEALGNNSDKKLKIYTKSFRDEYYNSKIISNIYEERIFTTNPNDVTRFKKIRDSLKQKDTYSLFQVDSICNILTASFFNPLVNEILTKEDLKKMESTFNNQSISWPKKLFNNVEVTNNKKEADVRISSPVFNIDGTLAMLYVKHKNSLSLEIYEKRENSWQRNGHILLMTSD